MKLRIRLAAATAIVSLSGLAHADTSTGWYAGLEAGANWINSVGQDQIIAHVVRGRQTLTFDTGWGALGTIGLRLKDNWRVEAEIGYRENKVDLFTGTHGTHVFTDGTNSEFTLMANVFHDFTIADQWSLSVGAGIGADNAHTTSRTFGFDDADWSFAYQVIVGVNYDLTPSSQVFTNFRYLNVDSVDYFDPSLAAAGTLHQDNIGKELLTIGIRFSLDP